MRSNVKPAPVVVDQRYAGSVALAKLPAQAEETPKPVMCCCRLDSLTVTSDACAVPPPHVPLPELAVELLEEPEDELATPLLDVALLEPEDEVEEPKEPPLEVVLTEPDEPELDPLEPESSVLDAPTFELLELREPDVPPEPPITVEPEVDAPPLEPDDVPVAFEEPELPQPKAAAMAALPASQKTMRPRDGQKPEKDSDVSVFILILRKLKPVHPSAMCGQHEIHETHSYAMPVVIRNRLL